MNLPADVTRCVNDYCPIRDTCLRWTQKHTGRIFSFLGPDENEQDCDYYLPDDDDGAQNDPANL